MATATRRRLLAQGHVARPFPASAPRLKAPRTKPENRRRCRESSGNYGSHIRSLQSNSVGEEISGFVRSVSLEAGLLASFSHVQGPRRLPVGRNLFRHAARDSECRVLIG